MGTPTEPAPFADLLRRHRQAAGLTQEELAEVALLAGALDLAGAERAAFEAAARGPGTPARRDPVVSAPVAALPLVSWAHEVALLARHLRGEGPPVMLLAGEPGIGKTRLLRAGLAVADSTRWETRTDYLLSNLGGAELELGHWHDAQGLLAAALRRSEAADSLQRAWSVLRTGELLRRQGRTDEAERQHDHLSWERPGSSERRDRPTAARGPAPAPDREAPARALCTCPTWPVG